MSKKENDNLSPDETESDEYRFLSEQIRPKPVNKVRLFKRTFLIGAGAAIFAIVACITFLVLEPIISNILYPEKIKKVQLPEIQDEVSPEEFLTEKDAEEEVTEAAKAAAEAAAEEAAKSAVRSSENMGIEAFETFYDELYEVSQKTGKCLVKVTGVKTGTDWFQQSVERENSVTGILVADYDSRFLIVADNAHLSNADSYSVTFADGSVATASLKDSDYDTGLGVFAVDSDAVEKETRETFSYASFGKVKQADILGRFVIAIGSPRGDFGSISYGTINSEGNQMRLADVSYQLLSSDIYANNQANGVLINAEGEILGIVTKSSMEAGGNHLLSAISIQDIHELIEKLSNNERRAYAGLHGMDVTEEAHKELNIPLGAYITEVDIDSPAMNAGITKGDVIIRAKDKEVKNFQDYQEMLMAASPGDVFTVTAARFNGSEYIEIQCDIATQLKE